MKYLLGIFLFVFLTAPLIKAQDYTFRYNPYSGMNKDQLELALKQSQKMEKSGKTWTAIGSGMLVGGAILMFEVIGDISSVEDPDFASFGGGLGLMCLGAFPLGYGLVAWITGSERSNMIEIELLSSDIERLSLQTTGNGVGLVYSF
jgi:hypothetical protein